MDEHTPITSDDQSIVLIDPAAAPAVIAMVSSESAPGATTPPQPVPVMSVPAPSMVEQLKAGLDKLVKSGARWFFWIAALSAINSIVAATGANLQFALGLGFNQVCDALTANKNFGGGIKVILYLLIIISCLFYFWIGYNATKRKNWAFILGMICYTLDAMLLLIDVKALMIGIVFHAWALYNIFRGWKANRQLLALEREESSMSKLPSSPAPPPYLPPPVG